MKWLTTSALTLSVLLTLTACGNPNAGTEMSAAYKNYMDDQPYVTNVDTNIPNTLPFTTSGGEVTVTVEPTATKDQLVDTILYATQFDGNVNTNIIFDTHTMSAQFYVETQSPQDATLNEVNTNMLNYITAVSDTNSVASFIYEIDYDGPQISLETPNNPFAVYDTITQITKDFNLNTHTTESDEEKTTYDATYTVTQNEKFTIIAQTKDDTKVMRAAYQAAYNEVLNKVPTLTKIELTVDKNSYTVNSEYSAETEAYLTGVTPDIKTVVNFYVK